MKIKVINGANVLVKVSKKDLINGVLTVPEGVNVIGKEAFSDCRHNLIDVIMPPSVTTAEAGAFAGCDVLERVSMPSITDIDEGMFAKCHSLTIVDIPNAIRIGKEAFAHCRFLKYLNIPRVIIIEPFAFYDCMRLARVDMPGVTTIGERAFSRCNSLSDVVLPSSITVIHQTAYYNTGNIRQMFIDSNDKAEIDRIKQLLPADQISGFMPKSELGRLEPSYPMNLAELLEAMRMQHFERFENRRTAALELRERIRLLDPRRYEHSFHAPKETIKEKALLKNLLEQIVAHLESDEAGYQNQFHLSLEENRLLASRPSLLQIIPLIERREMWIKDFDELERPAVKGNGI